MIKILLDSASDANINNAECDYIVPIRVNFGDEEYRAGVNLDSDTFYKKLTSESVFPQTSQPSPVEFEEIFSKVKQDGDELIYLAVSSQCSGTYQCAMLAKSSVDYDGIYVVFESDDGYVADVVVVESKTENNKETIDVYTYEDEYTEEWTHKYTLRSAEFNKAFNGEEN